MIPEVQHTVKVLQDGKTILYPTDTIWGIGCLAENENSYQRIFEIKEREQNKTFILLVSDLMMLLEYIEELSPEIANFLDNSTKPTTIIYKASKFCPKHLVAKDGTIAIRIPDDPFCKEIINECNQAIVSTSANISDEPNPSNFSEIDKRILHKVDYVVNWRQDENSKNSASQIYKLDNDKLIQLR